MAETDLEPKMNLDAEETSEWIASLDYILKTRGGERAMQLLEELQQHLLRHGLRSPFTANTPYINTIPADEQTPFPGSREIERRIKSLVRLNAMAMVVRAISQDCLRHAAQNAKPKLKWNAPKSSNSCGSGFTP